ncbi:MAG: DUF4760 domain-containing protein [Calothrix sp. MO_192.B10]|nr:DUF4760 domain-containing protein [Calothrix sp. MO_192.B10]
MLKNHPSPDNITTVNISFRFSLKASVLAFVVAAPFIFFYATTNDKNRDALNFAATALTTSIAGVTAFYALQSLKQNTAVQQSLRELEEKAQKEARYLEEKDRKIDRSLTYIMRWNDSYNSLLKQSVKEFYEITKGNLNYLQRAEKLTKYLDTYPTKEQDIINILNFLEEMSLCIHENIVDEELLYKFYRFIVIRYWKTLEGYVINRRQDMNNQNIYIGFEQLYIKWTKNRD